MKKKHFVATYGCEDTNHDYRWTQTVVITPHNYMRRGFTSHKIKVERVVETPPALILSARDLKPYALFSYLKSFIFFFADKQYF